MAMAWGGVCVFCTMCGGKARGSAPAEMTGGDEDGAVASMTGGEDGVLARATGGRTTEDVEKPKGRLPKPSKRRRHRNRKRGDRKADRDRKEKRENRRKKKEARKNGKKNAAQEKGQKNGGVQPEPSMHVVPIVPTRWRADCSWINMHVVPSVPARWRTAQSRCVTTIPARFPTSHALGNCFGSDATIPLGGAQHSVRLTSSSDATIPLRRPGAVVPLPHGSNQKCMSELVLPVDGLTAIQPPARSFYCCRHNRVYPCLPGRRILKAVDVS
ncbi:hypothetical protein Bbelb_095960 [Branchiostoma belcheri]|nr:hypothetical protein Bbelb_095960 [Branchiostoma belcheri]